MLSIADRTRTAAYRLLIANVYELAAVSRRASESIAAEHGVTVTQWHAMSVLSDDDVTVPAIARRLGVTRQAVQRVADQLVSSGHVEPRKNPSHSSSPVMHLTDLGHQTLRDLWEASDDPRAQLTRGLSAEEVLAASATLQKLLLDGFKTAESEEATS